MNHSESIKAISSAISKAQKEALYALADSENPFFGSRYADLKSIWEACRSPLTDNGLAVIQPTKVGDNGDVIIETVLMHSSGEWISGELAIKPDKPGPQALGSAITYGRRYALASMVGVSVADDDAEAATDRASNATVTDKQLNEIFDLAGEIENGNDRLIDYISKRFGASQPEELNGSQAAVVITMLKTKVSDNGAT